MGFGVLLPLESYIMKSVFIGFSLLVSFFGFSQNRDILHFFDTNGMETSLLVQQSPFHNLNYFNTNKNTTFDFYQAYKTIAQSDRKHRLKELFHLKNLAKQSYFTDEIPLAVLISDYETIKKEAFKNGDVINNSQGYLIRKNKQNIFKKESIAMASALRVNHKGLATTFKLNKNSIFNTTKNQLLKIEIDFDDGLGFQCVKLNESINIRYKQAGHKTLDYKLFFANGDIKSVESVINIIDSSKDLNKIQSRNIIDFTGTIIPDLSLYGEATSYAGKGEYELFLSTEEDAVLDKPIFITDGFDPEDNKPILGYVDADTGDYIVGIYDIFKFTNTTGETQNLLDLLRAEGFDIVILNFPVYTRAEDDKVIDGGVDFIERNAMLLVELIDIINEQKIGIQPNVVIGPSMGGLISQYALNYMENQSMNHDTRLWIAFDSPLEGANVPIGFQHQINFLANGLNDFWFIGNQNVEELQPIVDGMMKSNAARQMLVDQLEAHITNSDGVTFNSSLKLPQKHPFYNLFFDNMHALTSSGFPENLKKVSLINGSGIGAHYQDKNGNDILPGREVVDLAMEVETGTDAYLNVFYTPSANTTAFISTVYIDFAWYIPAFDVENNAKSTSFIYSDGVDAAPGGLFDLSIATSHVSSGGLAGEFVDNLQTDYFNFIPSVSAMAISFPNNEINWMHTPNNANTAGETPFDSWFMPETNELHITLSQASADFAWDEIVIPDIASNNEIQNKGITIVNPISDELIIFSKQTIDQVTLFDSVGKSVINTTFNSDTENYHIPVDLPSGLYVVRINSKNGVIYRRVLIK